MDVTLPKKHVTVRLDPLLANYLKTKPNVSRYVAGLIKQDYQQEHVAPIYEALITRLLKDPANLTLLAQALTQASRAPQPTTTNDDVVVVPVYD